MIVSCCSVVNYWLDLNGYVKERILPLKIIVNDLRLGVSNRLLSLIGTKPLLLLRSLRCKHTHKYITLLTTMFHKLLHVDRLSEDARVVVLLDLSALASIRLVQGNVSGHRLSELSIVNFIIIVFIVFLVVNLFGNLFCTTHFEGIVCPWLPNALTTSTVVERNLDFWEMLLSKLLLSFSVS